MKNCNHQWDKDAGIKKEGKPWVGIASRFVRTCQLCNSKQKWFGVHGWVEEVNYLEQKHARNGKNFGI